ncbi:MAG: SBBP repeat-containing protein [Terracidiphilus sp.]
MNFSLFNVLESGAARLSRGIPRRFAASFLMAAALCFAFCTGLCATASAQVAQLSTLNTTMLGGGGWSNTPTSVAVDSSGNVFFTSNTANGVFELPYGCASSACIQTVLTSPAGIQDIALDSSRNLYVSYYNGGAPVSILEYTYASGYNSATPIALGSSSFVNPEGMAVDASGNVFVADFTLGFVYEIPVGGGPVVPLPQALSPTGFYQPNGVALDSAGNVYVADQAGTTGIGFVYEILAPGYAATVMLGDDTVWELPTGIAVDASNNVYVVDRYWPGYYKMPPNCTNSSCMALQPNSSVLATPEYIALGANGSIYISDEWNNTIYQFTPGAINLDPPVAVGAAGPNVTLTFTFNSGDTLDPSLASGMLNTYTEGFGGMDFQYNFGVGTCFTNNGGAPLAYLAGQSCTVSVYFAPVSPGLRYGSVQLTDSVGTVIATGYLYGVGSAPQIGFLPATHVSVGSGFNNPQGVAVLPNGTVLVADTGNGVGVAVPGGPWPCSSSTPTGVAMDGAGNVLISDTTKGLILINSVCTTLGSGFNNPQGVAVDINGNVYVADTGNDAIKELTYASGYTVINTLGSGFSAPSGVAVDGSGNVYVADTGNNAVKEMMAFMGSIPASPTIIPLAGSYSMPKGVALDAIGNVYVADTGNGAVKELTYASGLSTVTTLTSGLTNPTGVAVDSLGNVYIASSSSSILELEDTVTPALNFTSNVGVNSADQTVLVENIGNAALTFEATWIYAAPYALDATTTCPSSGTLATGLSCALQIYFSPTLPGSFSGYTLTLTDNNLNANVSPWVTQSITMNGTATAPQAITWNAPLLPASDTYSVGLSYPISASGNGSGVNIVFSVSGPATLGTTVCSGAAPTCTNTVTVIGAGPVVVTANEPASGSYSAAPAVTQSDTIGQASQTITFTVASPVTFGVGPIQLSATASSGLTPVIFSVVSGPGTLSGPNNSVLSVNGAGSIVIAADQAGNANYLAAPEVQRTLVVNVATQAINFAMDSPVTFSPSPLLKIALVASDVAEPYSNNPILFTVISGPGLIVAGSDVLNVLGAGTIIVAANQAGDANYSAAPTILRSMVVNPAPQVITFDPLQPVTYGVAPFALSATGGGSGNPVTFSVLSGPGSVGPDHVTLTVSGAGTIVIAADQAASTNYAAATEVTQELIVNQAPQAITGFTVASPVTFGVAPITLTATRGASLQPLVFSIIAGNNYATLTPVDATHATLTITGAGTIVIAANELGNANYLAAPQVTQTLIVNQAAQAITFGALGTVEFGVTPITLSATDTYTPNSGNPITFTLISGPGILTGDVLTVTGAGPIVIEADQTGNQNYSAAPPVQQTLTVTKTWQGLDFALASPVTYSPNLAIALTATDVRTPNTGNPIHFSVVSGPGTISHDVLTVTGAGPIVVQAEQDGDTNYWPAHANRTLQVNSAPQTIVFTLPVASPITYSQGQTYLLQASDASINNSGNPIVFSLGAGTTLHAATLSGTNNSVLTVTGAGTIVINANQAAGPAIVAPATLFEYSAAPQVSQTLVVNNAVQAINFTAPASPIVFYGNHPNQTIPLTATDVYPLHSDMPIVLSVISGPGYFGTVGNFTCSVPGCSLTVTDAGSIVLAANQAAGPDAGTDSYGYLAAATVNQTIVVTQAPQTIVNTSPVGPVTYGVAPITLSAYDAAWNGSLLNNSGNPIVFTLLSGPGVLSGTNGTTLTVIGAGQIEIAANQVGNGDYLAAAQVYQLLVVNRATPTVLLTSTPNPVFSLNPVTFTATVSGPNAYTTIVPTGTVTFLNGTTPIGTSTLVNGVAMLTISSLPIGSDSITVNYIGDTNYIPNTSAVLTENVRDFTIASTGTNPQSVVPGATAVYSFTLTPVAPATTFPAAITLSPPTGLPVGATYTYSASTIASGASATTITLTVQTPSTTVASNSTPQVNTTLAQGGVGNSEPRPPTQRMSATKLASLAFALLLLPLTGRMRRTGRKLSRILPLLLLLIAGIAVAAGLSGCGGSPSGNFGQVPVTYTIQVTGVSGNLSHSASVTLVVE